MFCSVITNNSNWEILPKNLVTIKRWDYCGVFRTVSTICYRIFQPSNSFAKSSNSDVWQGPGNVEAVIQRCPVKKSSVCVCVCVCVFNYFCITLTVSLDSSIFSNLLNGKKKEKIELQYD